MVKKGLGSGLDALFGSKPVIESTPSGEKVLLLPLQSVSPNPNQPRRSFDTGRLDELTASVREQGILQPILVRPASGTPGKYEIVAGERRFRAAELAGLKHIPAIVKPLEDSTTLEVALIENIQRQDLNPLEEAASYRELLDKHKYTQAKLAEKLGKSRVYIANTMRLLALPEDICQLISAGRISAGHGRALLMLESAEDQHLLARKIIEDGLSVRETEALARDPALLHRKLAEKADKSEKSDKLDETKAAKPEDLLLSAVGEKLRERLQTRVSVQKKGKKGGKITLEYFNDEELERLLDLLLPGVEF